MAISPLCLVQDGAGPFVGTLNGVNVTAGNVISIVLAVPAGVTDWYMEVTGTDETSPTPSLANVNPGTHKVTSPGSTVSFTLPAGDGRAYLFQSTVLGVGGPLTTTFILYVLTDHGFRVGSTGEQREGNADHGWVTITNPLVRSGAPVIRYIDTLQSPASGSNFVQGAIDWLKTQVGGGGPPTGTAGGDLSGTYPNPGVAKLINIPIFGSPADTQTLIYNLALNRLEWAAGGGGTLGGDVTGPAATNLVSAIQGITAPSPTEALDKLSVVYEELRTPPTPGAIPYFSSADGMVSDGTYVYVSEFSGLPGIIHRLTLSGTTLVEDAQLDLNAASGGVVTQIRDISDDGTYLFAACWLDDTVAIIDKATFSVVGWATFTLFSPSIHTVCSDGTHLYALDPSDTTLSKFLIASLIGQPFGNSVPPVATLTIDGRMLRYGAGKLWLTGGGGNPAIRRIDPTTLTDDGLVTDIAGTGMYAIYAFGSVWVAGNQGGGPRVWRVDPATCLIQNTITPSAPFSVSGIYLTVGPDSAGVANQWVWVVGRGGPYVGAINPGTNLWQGTHTANPDTANFAYGCIANLGLYLYLGATKNFGANGGVDYIQAVTTATGTLQPGADTPGAASTVALHYRGAENLGGAALAPLDLTQPTFKRGQVISSVPAVRPLGLVLRAGAAPSGADLVYVLASTGGTIIELDPTTDTVRYLHGDYDYPTSSTLFEYEAGASVGTNLWHLGGGGGDRLQLVKCSDGTITAEPSLTQPPFKVVYEATSDAIFVLGNPLLAPAKLSKRNKTTGAVIGSDLTLLAGVLYIHVAFGYVWVMGTPGLFQVDPTTNTIINSFGLGSNIIAVAADTVNNWLYYIEESGPTQRFNMAVPAVPVLDGWFYSFVTYGKGLGLTVDPVGDRCFIIIYSPASAGAPGTVLAVQLSGLAGSPVEDLVRDLFIKVEYTSQITAIRLPVLMAANATNRVTLVADTAEDTVYRLDHATGLVDAIRLVSALSYGEPPAPSGPFTWRPDGSAGNSQERQTSPGRPTSPYQTTSQAPHAAGGVLTGQAADQVFAIPASVGGAPPGTFYFIIGAAMPFRIVGVSSPAKGWFTGDFDVSGGLNVGGTFSALNLQATNQVIAGTYLWAGGSPFGARIETGFFPLFATPPTAGSLYLTQDSFQTYSAWVGRSGSYVGLMHAGTTAGGDLSGTLPSPTVAKVRGVTVSAVAPTVGQVLTATSGSAAAWAAAGGGAVQYPEGRWARLPVRTTDQRGWGFGELSYGASSSPGATTYGPNASWGGSGMGTWAYAIQDFCDWAGVGFTDSSVSQNTGGGLAVLATTTAGGNLIWYIMSRHTGVFWANSASTDFADQKTFDVAAATGSSTWTQIESVTSGAITVIGNPTTNQIARVNNTPALMEAAITLPTAGGMSRIFVPHMFYQLYTAPTNAPYGYVVCGGVLYKLTLGGGLATLSATAVAGLPAGIVCKYMTTDGRYLYVPDSANLKIHKIDLITQTFVSSIVTTRATSRCVYDGKNLWYSSTDAWPFLEVIDTSGTSVKSFAQTDWTSTFGNEMCPVFDGRFVYFVCNATPATRRIDPDSYNVIEMPFTAGNRARVFMDSASTGDLWTTTTLQLMRVPTNREQVRANHVTVARSFSVKPRQIGPNHAAGPMTINMDTMLTSYVEVNTKTAATTIYLPRRPHDGMIVTIHDRFGKAATNNITIKTRPIYLPPLPGNGTIALSGITGYYLEDLTVTPDFRSTGISPGDMIVITAPGAFIYRVGIEQVGMGSTTCPIDEEVGVTTGGGRTYKVYEQMQAYNAGSPILAIQDVMATNYGYRRYIYTGQNSGSYNVGWMLHDAR